MNRRASTVRALVEALPGARLLGSGDSCVGRVVYDSRLVQPGDLSRRCEAQISMGTSLFGKPNNEAPWRFLLNRRCRQRYRRSS